MGWVTDALKQLAAGENAQVRPHGGSMRGRIESGQLVTIAPVDPKDVQVDDVVFVRWKGNFVLHLVKEIKTGSSSSETTSERLTAGFPRTPSGARSLQLRRRRRSPDICCGRRCPAWYVGVFPARLGKPGMEAQSPRTTGWLLVGALLGPPLVMSAYIVLSRWLTRWSTA